MAYQPKSYKKFVATAATATLVATAIVPVASAADAKSFKDVSKTYKVAVDYLVANDITQGMTETTFGTTKSITRGDAAIMIAKALKLNTTSAANAGFKDVNKRVAGAVNAVVEAKIASGTSKTTFNPDANITRQEMAKMIANAYNLKAGTTKNEFKDVNNNWDAYVDALLANGITLGKTATTFAATASVTRGEFALFVHRSETLAPAVVVEKVTVVNETTTTVAVKVANKELKASDFKVLVNGVAVSPTKVESDAKGEVYTITHASLKDTKGIVSVNGSQANFDYTAPVVESVKAINATEVLVTTNTTLNKDSAETLGNFEVFINGNAVTDVIKSAKLQADGKSVLVRFTTPITNGQTLKVSVKNTLLASNYNKVPAFTSEVQLFNDKVAPTLLGVEYTGAEVVATFSEPIASAANVRINGSAYTLNPTQTGATDVAGNYTYVITGAPTIAATYTVLVSQIKDVNGNETGTQSSTYTIVKDATAPVVSAIEAVNSTTLNVKFDKAVSGANAATAIANLKVEKNGVAFDSSRLTSVLAADKKSLTVTIAAPSGTSELSLYNQGETTATVKVSFDGYKDANGLLGTPYVGTVTLSKDSKAPAILSKNLVTVNNSGANTIVTVTYDEAVDAVTAQNANIVIKKDNIVQSAGTIAKPVVADVAGDTTERTVTLTFTGNLTDADYELTLPKGLVEDKEKNMSAQDSVKFTISSAATYFLPAVTQPTQSANTSNVISVVSVENLTDSALDVANYTLDDVALPTGTTINFVNDKKNIEITLPSTFKVASNANYKLGISNKVKNDKGSSAAASATTGGAFFQQVGLVDNVAPELEKAEIVEATPGQFKQIKLTFTEALGAHGSTDLLADFNVTVNGNAVAVHAVAAPAGSPTTNSVLVTIGNNTETFASSQATTVTVAPISATNTVVDVKDLQGNKLTTGKKVTATK